MTGANRMPSASSRTPSLAGLCRLLCIERPALLLHLPEGAAKHMQPSYPGTRKTCRSLPICNGSPAPRPAAKLGSGSACRLLLTGRWAGRPQIGSPPAWPAHRHPEAYVDSVDSHPAACQLRMASIGHRSISTLRARLTHQKNVVQIDILEYDQIFDQSRTSGRCAVDARGLRHRSDRG